MADADYDRILNAYDRLVNQEVHFPSHFGDGHAAERILQEIVSYLG